MHLFSGNTLIFTQEVVKRVMLTDHSGKSIGQPMEWNGMQAVRD